MWCLSCHALGSPTGNHRTLMKGNADGRIAVRRIRRRAGLDPPPVHGSKPHTSQHLVWLSSGAEWGPGCPLLRSWLDVSRMVYSHWRSWDAQQEFRMPCRHCVLSGIFGTLRRH